MDQTYRDATEKMEKMQIDSDYIIGWQTGYLNHPPREEQRAGDAYKAGYEDGQNKTLGDLEKWKQG